jgi:hypothetical protein
VVILPFVWSNQRFVVVIIPAGGVPGKIAGMLRKIARMLGKIVSMLRKAARMRGKAAGMPGKPFFGFNHLNGHTKR